MADGVKQHYINVKEAENYYGGPAYLSAGQGNEYGYSYYWWYYEVPNTSCHALEKRS